MMPDSALKSMRVMFATPCYISAVSMNYVASIFSLTLDSAHFGLPCILHLHSESLITRGRNKIVIKFLSEESFTHLFWIDFMHPNTHRAVCYFANLARRRWQRRKMTGRHNVAQNCRPFQCLRCPHSVASRAPTTGAFFYPASRLPLSAPPASLSDM
jgi:hypothetical protein